MATFNLKSYGYRTGAKDFARTLEVSKFLRKSGERLLRKFYVKRLERVESGRVVGGFGARVFSTVFW